MTGNHMSLYYWLDEIERINYETETFFTLEDKSKNQLTIYCDTKERKDLLCDAFKALIM